MTEHNDEEGWVDSESRLARWSRRKAEQRSSDKNTAPVVEPAVDPAQEPEIEGAAQQPLVDGESSEAELPLLTDADMPPVQSLNADSDFSGFLSPGVSEELRKLALRKMFSLPSFQLRDGLDDYDDDFTVFEPLGDTVTRDPWSRRQQRLAEEREAAERKAALGDQRDQPPADEEQNETTEQTAEDEPAEESSESATPPQSKELGNPAVPREATASNAQETPDNE